LVLVVILTVAFQQVGMTHDETLPYKYVGNSFTHIFHRPSCEFAHRIWHTRVELFHFRREAIEASYKPCNWCLPKTWTTLRGKVLQMTPHPSETPRPTE
jgi:methylphosphotriester-DNA--protein-cysteine methyltransferase